MAEIKLLGCTTVLDIRQMRRVKVGGVYKMQKFTAIERKQSKGMHSNWNKTGIRHCVEY